MWILTATNKNGDGHVQKVGFAADPSEFTIRVGMFADDVVLEMYEENDEK